VSDEVTFTSVRWTAPLEDLCDWQYDEADDTWETACGQSFQFYDGGPLYNRFRWCPYCGRALRETASIADTGESIGKTGESIGNPQDADS